MLKKVYRGLSRDQVSDLFSKDAKTAANAFFRIRWKTTAQDSPQFVVITTPSLHPSAVKRNRVRRRVYEWIRLNFTDWTKGRRVAILAKKPTLECTVEELDHALAQVFGAV